MSEQQALLHEPDKAGLWPSVRVGTTDDVDDTAWRTACDTHQFVGTCRGCGNLLRPGRPYRVGRVWWYPAGCVLTETCGYETAGHGPRPAPMTKGKGKAQDRTGGK